MRTRIHSLLSHLLVATLAMPAYAIQPATKQDPRQRLIQPVLPAFVDPGGLNNLQPNPDLNSAVSANVNSALAQPKATDPNTFKKNAGQAGGVPKLGGAGGSGAFSYNSAGSNGGSGGGDGGGGDGGGGGGAGGRAKEGKGSKSGGAQAFSKWWPMCLFLDQSISQAEGNATVKGLIDDAAACGVNLVVFPITIKSNYGVMPDIINNGSESSCNIVSGGLAEKASTSVCVDNNESADRMCDPAWEPKKGYNTAGCAQLQAGAGDKLKKKYQNDPALASVINQFLQSEGATAATGKAAPSIEDKNQCTKDIVGHEAIGHSEMGMPNGASHGKGIGNPMPGGGEPPAEGPWTGEGCASFVENGFPNDGRWKYDPNRTNYYSRIADPDKQWDLLGGKELFKPPGGPPPPGKPKGDRPGNQGPQQISYNEGGGKNPGGSASGGGGGGSTGDGSAGITPPSGAKDFAVVPPSQHKRKNPQQSMIDNLITNLQNRTPANDDAPPPQTSPVAAMPPRSGGKASTERIEYNESAPKARADGGTNSTFEKATAGPAPSEGGGFSTSTSYDESAPKNSVGGGGRTSIGYDESAPKGGSSFSSNVIRMGGADGAPSAAAGASAAAAELPALNGGAASIQLKPGAGSASGLSSDFFKDTGSGGGEGSSTAATSDDKEDARRRRRNGTLPGQRTRGRAPASTPDSPAYEGSSP